VFKGRRKLIHEGLSLLLKTSDKSLLKQTIRLYDRHLDYFKNTNSNLKFKTLTFRRQLTPSSELTPDLTFYRPAMTSSFSVIQLILMEMTLHGEESTNSSDEGVS